VSLFSALDLRQVGQNQFEAEHAETTTPVVFGGQILAQTVVAAARVVDDKRVKSLHTIFARGASTAMPLEIDAEIMQSGRSFASLTVSVSQASRLCARSLVLMDARDSDLIRHHAPFPKIAGPETTDVRLTAGPWWEIGTVGGVDISNPASVGPAELFVWTRFPGAPNDPVSSKAALAYATDGFLIGTAMRPHPGVGQALAHVTISTTVLSHTLTFHEDFDAGEWMLLAQESPYAGHGRSYGRGQVFTGDGRLVASFVQENMIRDMPAEQRRAEGERSKF
jgi:acyl-CoA thioesterase